MATRVVCPANCRQPFPYQIMEGLPVNRAISWRHATAPLRVPTRHPRSCKRDQLAYCRESASMAMDRITLVNMDRNNDLRLGARSPRRAKDFEPDFSRGSWFEFEIV